MSGRRGYGAGIIYADSRAMLRDRVTALRTANIYERQSYRHIALANVRHTRNARDATEISGF
jgi:3-phenylpropionate/cinnamic acid dioxygenase small subunit